MARNNNGNDCDNTNNDCDKTNHDNNSVDVANREIEVDVVDDDASTDSLISISERIIPNGQYLNRKFHRGDLSIDGVKQDNNDCGNKSLASVLDDEDEDEDEDDGSEDDDNAYYYESEVIIESKKQCQHTHKIMKKRENKRRSF